jgi:hypothetical protein
MIAIGTDTIEQVELFLNNTSGASQEINVQLRSINHIWDYRACTLPTLAEATLQVPPGKNWVAWPVQLKNAPVGQYVRLDVLPNPDVEWLIAGRIESGNLAMYQIGPDKMRRFGNGHTLSFRIIPAQPCYGPKNVNNGVARPHRYTNLWKSDPNQPLSQWLQLEWEEQKNVMELYFVFPGHILREYHAYQPFYRDPQCPKDYSVSAFIEGEWQTVLEVKNNYQRNRSHKLAQPVTTNKFRINIHSTNGDPSAQIYEVRCY